MDAALSTLGERWARNSGQRTPTFVRGLRQRLAEESSQPSVVQLGTSRGRQHRGWRLPLAAAAVLIPLLVLVASMSPGVRVWWRNANTPIGNVAYRDGMLTAPYDELRAGMRLEAGARERLVAALDDDRIIVGLAEGSTAEVMGRDALRLDRGEVWCEVRPGSGRFEVTTPHSTVVVVGTAFGVRLVGDSTVVIVTSGKVQVGNPQGSVNVGLGEAARVISLNSTPELAPALAITESRPAWAEALWRDAARAAAARRYPSGQLSPSNASRQGDPL